MSCCEGFDEKIKDLEELRDAYEARHLEHLSKLALMEKDVKRLSGEVRFYRQQLANITVYQTDNADELVEIAALALGM